MPADSSSNNTKNTIDIPPTTVKGRDNYDFYGRVDIQSNPTDLNATNLTRYNYGQPPGTTTAGAVQFKNQVSFDKDFDFNIRVATIVKVIQLVQMVGALCSARKMEMIS